MGDGSVAPALFDSGVASYSSGMSNTTITQPDHLFAEAQAVLAGGVSASMRLHPYLGRPLYVDRGEGPYLYGLDGKRYIDFNMSNGAALLGHDHPAVKRAVLHGVELGIITAAETPFHERLAARMVEIIPAAERVRFSSVGSEVTLVALRIARHATGRTKYLKFDGHFHGLTEPWLYRRADPLDETSAVVPSSGGVPDSGADDVVMVPWNDVAAFERAIAAHGEELAAVFCEPIHYNAGCIPPEPGFLELLRARCSEHGIVFVMDEVLSGFPHPPRRRAGAVRRHPGPDDPRQGAGQRAAARLRLRAGGADAQSRPDRPGRPQRDVLRASAQRAGRPRHPRGAEPARRL